MATVPGEDHERATFPTVTRTWAETFTGGLAGTAGTARGAENSEVSKVVKVFPACADESAVRLVAVAVTICPGFTA